jgi:hypothetical protein
MQPSKGLRNQVVKIVVPYYQGRLNPSWEWIFALVITTEDSPLIKGDNSFLLRKAGLRILEDDKCDDLVRLYGAPYIRRFFFISLRSKSKRIWILFASYWQTPFICFIFASKYLHKYSI